MYIYKSWIFQCFQTGILTFSRLSLLGPKLRFNISSCYRGHGFKNWRHAWTSEKKSWCCRPNSCPMGSMGLDGTGIFTYIWLIVMVNVGKYTIHGSYGCGKMLND